MAFSDYIIYVDESGDLSLDSVDKEYPIFLLTFCIFQKIEYSTLAKAIISKLKFDFWGHDTIVLHGHKIRSQSEAFAILGKVSVREKFINTLNESIRNIPFQIITAVIDKRELRKTSDTPENPYTLAMEACMDKAYTLLKDASQQNNLTHIVAESRGKKEDQALELAFRRLISESLRIEYCFDLVFADKRLNSAGLQIADLVSHPIGRHIIKPTQSNRAFEIVEEKLYKYPEYLGEGLQLLPMKAKSPGIHRGIDAGREAPNPFINSLTE